jgi:hypothetical protein
VPQNLDKWLFGLGLGTLSIAQVIPLLDQQWITPTRGTAYVGLAIILAGVGVHLWKRRPEPWVTSYYSRSCAADEAPNVHALMVELLGNDIGTLQQMQSWLLRDNRSIQLLFRVKQRAFSRESELAGFFSVFEITKTAFERMERNELTGVGLATEHICQENRKGYAIYIGAIGAVGRRQKGELLRHVNAHVAQRAASKIRHVLTRPTANAAGNFESVRAVDRHGFRPVVQSQPLGAVNYILKLPIHDQPSTVT